MMSGYPLFVDMQKQLVRIFKLGYPVRKGDKDVEKRPTKRAADDWALRVRVF